MLETPRSAIFGLRAKQEEGEHTLIESLLGSSGRKLGELPAWDLRKQYPTPQ